MNNNDILIRLRYALDLSDSDMVAIYKQGKKEVNEKQVKQLLTKKAKDETAEEVGQLSCSDELLESFLNGLIIHERGERELKPGQTPPPAYLITGEENRYNIVLKKLKIALNLTGDDMRQILYSAGILVSKGELTAVFRKEGHRNYKPCGERYMRNFLKGLTMKYRDVQ